jgi:hypothetical protein
MYVLFCICTTRQWFWNIQYGVQGVTEAWIWASICVVRHKFWYFSHCKGEYLVNYF